MASRLQYYPPRSRVCHTCQWHLEWLFLPYYSSNVQMGWLSVSGRWPRAERVPESRRIIELHASRYAFLPIRFRYFPWGCDCTSRAILMPRVRRLIHGRQGRPDRPEWYYSWCARSVIASIFISHFPSRFREIPIYLSPARRTLMAYSMLLILFTYTPKLRGHFEDIGVCRKFLRLQFSTAQLWQYQRAASWAISDGMSSFMNIPAPGII